jgi:hypothetical protein
MGRASRVLTVYQEMGAEFDDYDDGAPIAPFGAVRQRAFTPSLIFGTASG